MSYSPGDIVGIPFPYSDLKTKKKRPVLILTSPDQRGDFICVAVTSVPTDEYAVPIDNDSMNNGILPLQSWVRCDKIFTLSQSDVIRHFGSLNSKAYGSVMEKVCANLNCG